LKKLKDFLFHRRKESHTGLEQHAGENMIKDFHFGGTIHLFVYILDEETLTADRDCHCLVSNQTCMHKAL